MPDYSKVSAERDVFGELGWVPNFNAMKSKNNEDRHENFKEYFDAPKDYTTQFHTSTMTNHDLNQLNSAQDSTAHQKEIRSNTFLSVPRSTSNRSSNNGSPISARGNSVSSFGNTRKSLN